MERRSVLAMAALATGLSGFCGLIYLSIWDETVKNSLGDDAISATIMAAASLLGLGLGAYLFGRCRNNPFKTFAFLGLALGLYAILSFHLIGPVAGVFAQLFKPAPEAAGGVRAAVVLGSMLLLLPSSALVGGALPLLFRCFTNSLRHGPGMILGIAALGASLGSAALPLLFLNRLSLSSVLSIVGGINIAMALSVLLWSYRQAAAASADAAPAADKQARRLPLLIYGLTCVSGFILSAFAVSLLRALPIVNPSSAYNSPLALMFILLALALGSVFFARDMTADRDAILYRIGWLVSGSTLGMFLGIWAGSHLSGNLYPVSLLPVLEGSGYANLPWVLLFCVVLIMPPPLLLGAVLPLLLKLHAGAAGPADGAGRLCLSAFLGACCGLILGKFAGFPLLGTQGFLSFVYFLGCTTGIGVMTRLWRRNLTRKDTGFSGALPGALTAAALMLAVIIPPGIWLTYITGGPEENWEVREGLSGVAQLWWEEEHADLRVNGEYMSRLPYHPRHIKQEIFLLAQPKRAKVLVLGMGGAEIIRSLAEDAAVKSIDVVDSSHELPGILADGRAAEMLNHALSSPKVRILTADARLVVGLYETGAFDLVFDNLAFASWAGSTRVKSESYFREIKRILKPDGVFLTGANYFGRNRLAVLAGLVNTFEVVKEHRHAEIVIATSEEPQYFDFRIIQLTEPRAAIFGLNYTAQDALPAWFRNEFIPIGREQLLGVAPMRDDLLVYEYFWESF